MSKKRSLKTKEIPILYQNESYIVFQKPANLLVIPTPKNEDNTLVNIVNEQNIQEDGRKLYPCHRLDKETSGVLVFALGKKNQKKMMQLFQEKKVSKRYIAFVYGKVKRDSGSINKSIASLDARKYSYSVKKKDAETHFKVLGRRKAFSIIEAVPVTGRANQIRIHFKQIGHPLVGDRKYAKAKDYSVKFRRTALHASEIAWEDEGQKIKVNSKLPNDMEVFLASN